MEADQRGGIYSCWQW